MVLYVYWQKVARRRLLNWGHITNENRWTLCIAQALNILVAWESRVLRPDHFLNVPTALAFSIILLAASVE